MSPDQKRAKDLYIKGKKPSEIAEELELSISTVYKWIKDEKLGFEKAKRLANFSVDAMGEMLLEVYKEFIVGLQDNPERLKDPATADSVIKMTKAIKSLEKDVDYLGVSADIIKKATELIREEYPNYLDDWKNIVPKLLEHLEEEYGK